MRDVKSQFTAGGVYTDKNFLLDSFSMLGEDTRKGLSQTAATKLAAMEGYVAANPEKTSAERFNGYVGKLLNPATNETETKPTVAMRSKLGTGIM